MTYLLCGLILAFSCSLSLSLALNRRLLVMFAFANFCEHSATSTGALKATKCTIQRLVLFYTYFRQSN